MTYRQFRAWCNKRAADGCWGMKTALFCIDIIGEVEKIQFWRREKVWREKYQEQIMRDVVEPIEKKMIEVYGKVL